MRRITLWLFSTIAALVLLFSYRTSTDNGAGGGAVTAGVPADPAPSNGSAPTASPGISPSVSSSATPGSSSGTKTYSGSTAPTRWGDVRVTITVTNGKITDVHVPVHPSGNGRDAEINAYSLPILEQETLQTQSADIHAVSGATVTSDGYLQSLQAALDAAHLA